jgi:hypothetical protein
MKVKNINVPDVFVWVRWRGQIRRATIRASAVEYDMEQEGGRVKELESLKRVFGELKKAPLTNFPLRGEE